MPSFLACAFDVAISFLVWLFSTSFRDCLTPRLGRRFSVVCPPFSLSSPELSLEERRKMPQKKRIYWQGAAHWERQMEMGM